MLLARCRALPSRLGGGWPESSCAEDFASSADGFEEFVDFHDFYWNDKDVAISVRRLVVSGLQLCLKLSVRRRFEPEMHETPGFCWLLR